VIQIERFAGNARGEQWRMSRSSH